MATGYVLISFDGEQYLAHRLAWFYVTGEMPPMFIDHINGKPDDNRFENLREATPQQNGFNRGMPKNNKSGAKGCEWRRDRGKYRV